MFRMEYTLSFFVRCYCPYVAAYTFKRQEPHLHNPIGDHSNMRGRANAVASPLRGSICLESPDMGRFWGRAFIHRSIWWRILLASRPLGTINQWQMEVSFALSFWEAPSCTATSLPHAKWWKYEGLGLNCQWWQGYEWVITLVRNEEIDKLDEKENRRW